jgi:hypothetical protein
VLTRLAAERGALYAEVADLTFSPTGVSANEAAESLLDLLEIRWQRPAGPFTALESS